MITKFKALYFRYKEAILYVVFGGCTTLVNIVSYYVCEQLGISTALSTVIAWVLAVLFAYITNKLFVFESRSTRLSAILREATQFFLCRAATGLFDVGFMVLTVDVFHLYGLLMKILSNVVVMVLNYVFSKWWIFKKKS